MGVVPKTIHGRIAFFENRVDLWTANADRIGLTPAQTDALAARAAAARDAYCTALTARDHAVSATEAQNVAVGELADLGGDLVNTIRAYALANNDPAVFALANVPAPAAPSPRGAPDTPAELVARLNNSGGIALSFKASRAGGTTFVVQRRTVGVNPSVPGTSSTDEWTTLGVTNGKTFTDDTLPRGLAQADYRVYATRAGGTSQPTQPVGVLFGTVDSGPNLINNSSNHSTSNGGMRIVKLAG